MPSYFISKYAFPNGKITVVETDDSIETLPNGYVVHPSYWQAYKVGDYICVYLDHGWILFHKTVPNEYVPG